MFVCRMIRIQDASPFLFLGPHPIPEMRSDSNGRIVTVTKMGSTNRVHGAVCSRQVQMDQAVGLGQEQIQVLQEENRRLFRINMENVLTFEYI